MSLGGLFSWYCSHCPESHGASFWEADGEAEAKAVAGALRHWRKFHADHGEEDTREAAAEIGPSAYGGPDRRSLEWWKKEGTE